MSGDVMRMRAIEVKTPHRRDPARDPDMQALDRSEPRQRVIDQARLMRGDRVVADRRT